MPSGVPNVQVELQYPHDNYIVGDTVYERGRPVSMPKTQAESVVAAAAAVGVPLVIIDPRAASEESTGE